MTRPTAAAFLVLAAACGAAEFPKPSADGTVPPELFEGLPRVKAEVGGVPVTVGYLGGAVSRDVSDPAGTLFAAVELAVRNDGPAEAAIDFAGVQLNTAGRSIEPAADRATLTSLQYFLGPRHVRVAKLPPATAEQLRPGGVRVVGLAYRGLPAGGGTESLRLEGGALSGPIDLTAMAAEAADMGVTRVGPGGAVGVVTVAGRLDRLGLRAVCRQVTELAGRGCRRVVMHFPDGMAFARDDLAEWFERASDPQTSYFNYVRDLPLFPQTVSAARISDGGGVFGEHRHKEALADDPRGLFRGRDEAVASAAKDVFRAAGRDAVLKGLRTGADPGVLAAMLGRGAAVLAPADFPAVRPFLSSDRPAVRAAAVRSLAAFPQGEAVEALVEAFSGEDAELRRVARQTLSELRFADSAAGLERLPESVAANAEAMAELAGRPRASWAPDFDAASRSKDADLRVAGLKGLVALGGPPAEEAVTRGVLDGERRVRAAVAEMVFNGAGRDYRAAAASAAARRIRGGAELDASVLSLADAAADPDVVTHLLDRLPELDAAAASGAMRLIARGGRPEDMGRVADVLIERIRAVDPEDAESMDVLSDARAAMNVLQARRSPRLFDVAEALLTGGLQSRVAKPALTTLKTSDDPRALDLLKRLFEDDAALDIVPQVAEAMTKLGGRGVQAYFAGRIEALEPSEGTTERRFEAALNAYRTIEEQSPAQVLLQRAYQFSQRRDRVQTERAYEAALKVDPGHSRTYSARALDRLMAGPESVEEVVADCRKAIELDPLYGGPRAALGLALAHGGDAAGALEALEPLRWWMTEESNVTAYNAGCVLGLVVGLVEAAGESDPLYGDLPALRKRGLEYVERSVELGFREADHIRADTDLKALRGPELDRIIGRAAGSDG